jgi:tRNA1(Val) A37 N6-methylase TrmN6
MINHLSTKERKKAGVHYTPLKLADFIAKQILNAWCPPSPSEKIRFLDPAVGDGQLLLSLLANLLAKDYPKIEVSGFDTNSKAIETANARIKSAFPKVHLNLNCNDFLEFVLTNYAPNGQYSLFTSPSSEQFDIVIANPPYVRTQVMGQAKAQTIARQFGLSGRVDLYYAFIEGIAEVLRPEGIAGVIVSNRFLTTKSGVSIRKGIVKKFEILHIWDLGDTQLFEAAVLPAVLLLQRKSRAIHAVQPKFTSIYSISDINPEYSAEDILTALEKEGVVEVENKTCYQVQHGTLNYEKNPAQVWRITNNVSENWLAKVKGNTFCTFGDIGKIRVGVKTTADSVFIRSDWQDMPAGERPELLKPLTTHHIARRFKAAQPKKQRQILYPHQVVGGKRVAVNLNEFPRSARYLYSYRSVLEKREYVLKSGRQWYEIWVPQDPEAWKYPKVVFRDIAEKPTFWLDSSGSIVNGDCYWFVSKDSTQINLLWLILAVGNSSFIETFYDYRFNNKLYSGRRRFITQYVEKFPLPDPNDKISKCIIHTAQQLYDLLPSSPQVPALEQELDELVWEAFGLSVEKVAG